MGDARVPGVAFVAARILRMQVCSLAAGSSSGCHRVRPPGPGSGAGGSGSTLITTLHRTGRPGQGPSEGNSARPLGKAAFRVVSAPRHTMRGVVHGVGSPPPVLPISFPSSPGLGGGTPSLDKVRVALSISLATGRFRDGHVSSGSQRAPQDTPGHQELWVETACVHVRRCWDRRQAALRLERGHPQREAGSPAGAVGRHSEPRPLWHRCALQLCLRSPSL